MGYQIQETGTERRCIRGKYYLYECASFYDMEKKKTRKKTEAYLGVITRDKGFVPPRRKLVEIAEEKMQKEVLDGKIPIHESKAGQIQEYGLSAFIAGCCGELLNNLKKALLEPHTGDGPPPCAQPVSVQIYSGGFCRQSSSANSRYRRAFATKPD